MLNGLDLCSGIAGITEALATWVRPVAYCESDRFCQSVLVSRIERGEIPNAPIWTDLTTLRGHMLPKIDIVYAGFPCQAVSVAGSRKGMVSESSGLYFHVWRIIKETNPRFVLLENVPGIKNWVPMVRHSLKSLGYECRDGILSAADIGAWHKRERWFLVGNAKTTNAASKRVSGQIGQDTRSQQSFSIDLLEGDNWDERASFLLRVDNGIPYRDHRIKSLGNGVVPCQVEEAFKKMIGITPNPEE